MENLSNYHVGSDHLSIGDYLGYQSAHIVNTPKLLTMSKIEYGYTTTSQQATFIQQFDTESSNLNKISSYDTALAVTNLNTQNALQNAKQDR
jgi:hypothetical protein